VRVTSDVAVNVMLCYLCSDDKIYFNIQPAPRFPYLRGFI
jgi:hypothetical protein